MPYQLNRRDILRLGGAVALGAALPSGQLLTATARAGTSTSESATSGPSIQVDPLFAYYLGRSADSIAEELKLAGYDIVHYVIVDETDINGDLVRACKKHGLAVWAMVFGNGTYSTANLPEGWQSWQMGMLDPSLDYGYTFLSHFSDGYRRWKRDVGAAVVREHPFDGYEMAEAYFPEWDGLRTRRYGDIGPLALDAFRRRYHRDAPEFSDSNSPLYYAKPQNAGLYRQWVDFRVDAVNGFVDEIMNGPGGIRSARPGALVGSWSMGIDAGPDSVDKMREYQGLDALSMVKRVRPDVHYVQTHWPDWTRSDLPPDYLRTYEPFVEQLRRKNPDLPLGVQTDLGSWHTMERSKSWLQAFDKSVSDLGYATWTGYEYHIDGTMYLEPPIPRIGIRLDARRTRISFSKRIDLASASLADSFTIVGTGSHPTDVTVDGNRAELTWSSLPAGPFDVAIRNITDTPQFWLRNGHDHPANAVPAGATIRVP